MAKRTPLAPLATGTNNNNNNIDDDDGDNNNNNNNNNDENDNNNNNNNFFFTEYCYENEPKPDAIRQAAAIQKLILAHRVLKIAPMNPFVLCQPTNAAAHSNKCVTPLVIPPHGRLFARSK